jgi:hypothetical protein
MSERAISAPVFLVGCPRSGTTLLQRLLDAHSLLAVAPETHFVRRFWIKRDDYGDLAAAGAFDRVVEEVIQMPEFSDMQLDAGEFRDQAARIERTIPAVFDLLLRSFARRRGVRLVGEKTPNHLLYMPTLEGFFPGARFIHIIRDPRAVVNSWRTVPWSTGSIAGDTAVWQRYMQTAWKQPPTGGRLHVMRYETLATEPEPELRAVCDFLGIPFEPTMLSFHERESRTVDFAREPWKRNAALPIQTQARDEWRSALAPGQIVEIERLARNEMLRLGYKPERYTAPSLLRRAGRAARRLLSRPD